VEDPEKTGSNPRDGSCKGTGRGGGGQRAQCAIKKKSRTKGHGEAGGQAPPFPGPRLGICEEGREMENADPEGISS